MQNIETNTFEDNSIHEVEDIGIYNSLESNESETGISDSLDVEKNVAMNQPNSLGSSSKIMRMAEHGCLTVTIEAGRLQITLGELIKLSSGDVLELKPYPVELKLRVGENYIAEGILVEINGRVGVQITTMY